MDKNTLWNNVAEWYDGLLAGFVAGKGLGYRTGRCNFILRRSAKPGLR